MDKVLSGWQLAGILQMRTGIPLNIRNAFDSTLRGIPPLPPDITGGFQRFDPRQVQKFKLPNGRTVTGNFVFDPSVFKTIRPRNAGEARVGNLERNVFTGPGVNNFDLSLLKRFSWADRHRVEIRMDVTNVFNHAQFRVNPRTLSTNSFQFGRTFRTLGPRRIQFVLRYSF